ncbi:sensor histidine kinase [Nocardioides ferulae]|uniref:sensor histidine kinase n=1 Tax=Nocardioides ferulae TaxID=2340821 RepID=UPI0013DE0DB6|nr:histidine kinase [Nocardioides ferulae]
MSDLVGPSPALSRARLLTVVWLVSAVLSVVLLPLVGVAREPSVLFRTTGLAGVGLLFSTQLLVMWSAVTPWASVSTHHRAQTLFVLAAILSVPSVAPVAVEEWATWAWLGASVLGTAPLLWRWPTVAMVAVATTSTSLAVALVFDGDVLTYGAVTLGIGAGLATINWAPFWMWELLVRADATRQAGARAAAALERNRFGRDVHDVLGHALTVIALKAELAARTAASDPVSSARESEEVRALAETTLGRLRSSLALGREVDLRAELAAMERVLAAAAVRCDLAVQPIEVSPQVAGALSMLLKEATTNVLRHSDAQWCRVELGQEADRVQLSVTNDRPLTTRAATGSGLVGLRARLGAVGGDLSVHHDDGSFRISATVPAGHG